MEFTVTGVKRLERLVYDVRRDITRRKKASGCGRTDVEGPMWKDQCERTDVDWQNSMYLIHVPLQSIFFMSYMC